MCKLFKRIAALLIQLCSIICEWQNVGALYRTATLEHAFIDCFSMFDEV